MGLDNYVYAKSDHRTLTRDMLPKEIDYPYSSDYAEGEIELVYWRKNWGLRTAIVRFFGVNSDEYQYVIDKPEQIFSIMKIILYFMDEKVWNEEGQSIWEYDEIRHTLEKDIINLAIMAAFMQQNPDVYLIFVDSY